MDKKAGYKPTDSLIFLTNRVGRLLANQVKQHLDSEEMEAVFPHIGVLVDVWLKDGIRQQDLAVSVIKDKGTIARSLDILERHNMVVRIPDEQDKRKKRIYLTHKGKSLRCRVEAAAQVAIEAATRGLAGAEVTLCKKILSRMYQNLKD